MERLQGAKNSTAPYVLVECRGMLRRILLSPGMSLPADDLTAMMTHGRHFMDTPLLDFRCRTVPVPSRPPALPPFSCESFACQSLRLLPQHVRHDWLTVDTNSFPSPAFAVSPVLDATGSDYVYLTIGDSVRKAADCTHDQRLVHVEYLVRRV